MDQSVVEQDEPVDGEPPRVLQGQSFVAALADQPAVRLPQGVLTAQRQVWVYTCSHQHTQNEHTNTVYRHFAGKRPPEVKGDVSLLPFSLQLQIQTVELGAAVLQLLVISGALNTSNKFNHTVKLKAGNQILSQVPTQGGRQKLRVVKIGACFLCSCSSFSF